MEQEFTDSEEYGIPANTLDPSISWKDIYWLQSLTRLPIIIKGILTKEDAELAVEHGVQGIIVSNHGGRQLDGGPATVRTPVDSTRLTSSAFNRHLLTYRSPPPHLHLIYLTLPTSNIGITCIATTPNLHLSVQAQYLLAKPKTCIQTTKHGI